MECGTEEDDGHFNVIRELGSGEHFGEISLINNVKRTLSVRVKGDAQLLSLSKNAFSRILGSIKSFLKEDYKNDRHSSVDGSVNSSPRALNQEGLFDIKEDTKGENGSRRNSKTI